MSHTNVLLWWWRPSCWWTILHVARWSHARSKFKINNYYILILAKLTARRAWGDEGVVKDITIAVIAYMYCRMNYRRPGLPRPAGCCCCCCWRRIYRLRDDVTLYSNRSTLWSSSSRENRLETGNKQPEVNAARYSYTRQSGRHRHIAHCLRAY